MEDIFNATRLFHHVSTSMVRLMIPRWLVLVLVAVAAVAFIFTPYWPFSIICIVIFMNLLQLSIMAGKISPQFDDKFKQKLVDQGISTRYKLLNRRSSDDDNLLKEAQDNGTLELNGGSLLPVLKRNRRFRRRLEDSNILRQMPTKSSLSANKYLRGSIYIEAINYYQYIITKSLVINFPPHLEKYASRTLSSKRNGCSLLCWMNVCNRLITKRRLYPASYTVCETLVADPEFIRTIRPIDCQRAAIGGFFRNICGVPIIVGTGLLLAYYYFY